MPSRSRSRTRKHTRSSRRRHRKMGAGEANAPGWSDWAYSYVPGRPAWARMPTKEDIKYGYEPARSKAAEVLPEQLKVHLRPMARWLERQIEERPEYFVYIPAASLALAVSALGLRAAWPAIKAKWEKVRAEYKARHPSAKRSKSARRSKSSKRSTSKRRSTR